MKRTLAVSILLFAFTVVLACPVSAEEKSAAPAANSKAAKVKPGLAKNPGAKKTEVTETQKKVRRLSLKDQLAAKSAVKQIASGR